MTLSSSIESIKQYKKKKKNCPIILVKFPLIKLCVTFAYSPFKVNTQDINAFIHNCPQSFAKINITIHNGFSPLLPSNMSRKNNIG